MFTLSWLLLIAIVAGALGVIDGIWRVRGRGASVLGIIEIIVAALFLLSLFLPGIPFGSLTLAIVLLIVLIVGLIMGRLNFAVAIISLVLTALWIVLSLHWIMIVGVNA
ncbi:hypothetical protein HII28_18980 [Planctomonas sp. JC2975]|uniref:hypothetical protein n=1 Tax=Planctomonas sp. JC2975 TaxID=2729626 RepID=UPI0014761E69|nr:hypothetical protein [Planctomonas sp. JC2975]NNC13951.1 hypothetical protein [Planctomonas sp. JC2975]